MGALDGVDEVGVQVVGQEVVGGTSDLLCGFAAAGFAGFQAPQYLRFKGIFTG